tara:strand:+ start:4128 stop:5267 length:1140 start_codon:yes stop_codon:yes gene_type:complete
MNKVVISVGYGEHLFVEGNAERLRMEACAREVGVYQMVVFVKNNNLTVVHDQESGLSLYPIAARLSILKLLKAILITRKLVAGDGEGVTVTAQDPFETGLVAWLSTRFNRAKLNIQEHGDVFSTNYWRNESALNQVRFKLGLFLIKRADSVRVVSKRIKNTLVRRGVDENSIKQLPVVTDPSQFENTPASTEPRTMFESGAFIFLSIARFVPQKNFPLLIKSFYEARKNCSHIRLLIAGTGEEHDAMKGMIADLDPDLDAPSIRIISWINDVPGFMKGSDAYVLSSNYEGWGRVLIEAKYSELPVVTTDVGCVGEAVLDKLHGKVVPLDDVASLSKAMVEMASDKEAYTSYVNNLKKEVASSDSLSTYAKRWATVTITD